VKPGIPLVVDVAIQAAALTSYFYHNGEECMRSYVAAGPALAGFPGFWQVLGRVAVQVTAAEARGKPDFSDTEWIPYTARLARAMHAFFQKERREPTDDEIRTLVMNAEGEPT
jgi:hypothetical protein